ncbi:MAG: hypothetical protein DRI61_09880 [Chloroflexi bacterium]|nr:MAG: hypothetical protein DRI61_09880 [Chloroflexota bacterium]
MCVLNKNKKRLLTIFLGILPLIFALTIHFTSAQEFLPINWDLEGPYYQTDWGKVAPNWTPFVISGTLHFDNTVEFYDNPLAEHWTGSTSQLLISSSLYENTGDGVYKAGILQHITGLRPGQYGFRAKILTIFQSSYMGPGAPNRDDKMFKAVGIDPTGGTDPQSPAVIWSPWDGKHMQWRDMRVTTDITGTEATLFVAVDSPNPYGPYPHENVAFIDALAFVRAPTVTLTATLRPGHIIHLDWEAQPAELGYLTGKYDLAVRSDGDWQPLLEQAAQTSYDFVAAYGVTYTFRLRAWEHYNSHPANRGDDPLLLYGEQTVSIRYEDHLPPTVTVNALPAYSPERFWVSWSGEDDLTGIATYDVQFQEDSGPWQDWVTGTTQTGALFTGTPGKTYGFRVRATDYAGNIADWPNSAQAVTTIPPAGIRGRILGPDGAPAAGVVVTGTGALAVMPPNGSGLYGLYYQVAAPTPVSITASSPLYLPPDPFHLSVLPNSFIPLTITMRPKDDMICEGGFERLTSCWEVGTYSNTHWVTRPVTLLDQSYNGHHSALLMVNSILSQTLSFAGTLQDLFLTFWTRPISRTGPLTLTIFLSPLSEPPVFQRSIEVGESNDWSLNVVPLPPVTGTLALHLSLRGAAGDGLGIDALSLGSPPLRCYLPLVFRDGSY